MFFHNRDRFQLMNEFATKTMTVDEFLVWSSRQDKGRYELQDGWVIMQQAQNIGHLKAKKRIVALLDQAVERAGIPFYVMPDGATVRISKRIAFEPDALVAPLPMPDDTSLEIPNPVIVVEILSPSSIKRDLVDKLAGYFQIASIQHYLVLDPEEKEIIWHRRCKAGGLEPPQKLKSGVLRLEPMGLEVNMASVFPIE